VIRVLALLVLALGTGLGGSASGETAVYFPPSCPEPRDGASDEVLLRCFAPVVVAAGVEESYNRIGSLVLEQSAFGGLSVHVDPDLPTLYTEVRPDIVGGEMVLQLVYRMHFERIPLRLSRFFFEAHRNPGLLVVVTLDARSAKPLFVTVAHTCGCYAAVLPTENVPRAALPPDRPLDAIHVYGVTLPGILGIPSPDARLMLRLQAENHRITDVSFANALPEGRAIPVKLRPMAELRDMPVIGGADGARASVFHDTWPARGHLRGAWNPLEGLTIFGIAALDPMVGMDKDFGDPEQTGTEFYTMLTPWKQSASRLDRFDRLLRELGYQTDTIW
jgi:hypothetical protein